MCDAQTHEYVQFELPTPHIHWNVLDGAMRTISRIVASHVDASDLADDLCEARIYGTFGGYSETDRADARLTEWFNAVGTPRRCKNRSSGGLQATRGRLANAERCAGYTLGSWVGNDDPRKTLSKSKAVPSIRMNRDSCF